MTLLDVYLSVTLCTALAIIAMAAKLRKSHGMRSLSILQLAVLAGGVWPLLAFAALQAGGLFLLAKGLGMLRGPRTTRISPPVYVPQMLDSRQSA
jgi:hypothetical protein